MLIARGIILLVRTMDLCGQALQTAEVLLRSGASVALFYMVPAELLDDCTLKVLQGHGNVHCYAHDANVAARAAVGWLCLAAMADRIKQADLVIAY